jgi:hypothetical protein
VLSFSVPLFCTPNDQLTSEEVLRGVRALFLVPAARNKARGKMPKFS